MKKGKMSERILGAGSSRIGLLAAVFLLITAAASVIAFNAFAADPLPEGYEYKNATGIYFEGEEGNPATKLEILTDDTYAQVDKDDPDAKYVSFKNFDNSYWVSLYVYALGSDGIPRAYGDYRFDSTGYDWRETVYEIDREIVGDFDSSCYAFGRNYYGELSWGWRSSPIKDNLSEGGYFVISDIDPFDLISGIESEEDLKPLTKENFPDDLLFVCDFKMTTVYENMREYYVKQGNTEYSAPDYDIKYCKQLPGEVIASYNLKQSTAAPNLSFYASDNNDIAVPFYTEPEWGYGPTVYSIPHYRVTFLDGTAVICPDDDMDVPKYHFDSDMNMLLGFTKSGARAYDADINDVTDSNYYPDDNDDIVWFEGSSAYLTAFPIKINVRYDVNGGKDSNEPPLSEHDEYYKSVYNYPKNEIADANKYIKLADASEISKANSSFYKWSLLGKNGDHAIVGSFYDYPNDTKVYIYGEDEKGNRILGYTDDGKPILNYVAETLTPVIGYTEDNEPIIGYENNGTPITSDGSLYYDDYTIKSASTKGVFNEGASFKLAPNLIYTVFAGIDKETGEVKYDYITTAAWIDYLLLNYNLNPPGDATYIYNDSYYDHDMWEDWYNRGIEGRGPYRSSYDPEDTGFYFDDLHHYSLSGGDTADIIPCVYSDDKSKYTLAGWTLDKAYPVLQKQDDGRYLDVDGKEYVLGEENEIFYSSAGFEIEGKTQLTVDGSHTLYAVWLAGEEYYKAEAVITGGEYCKAYGSDTSTAWCIPNGGKSFVKPNEYLQFNTYPTGGNNKFTYEYENGDNDSKSETTPQDENTCPSIDIEVKGNIKLKVTYNKYGDCEVVFHNDESNDYSGMYYVKDLAVGEHELGKYWERGITDYWSDVEYKDVPAVHLSGGGTYGGGGAYFGYAETYFVKLDENSKPDKSYRFKGWTLDLHPAEGKKVEFVDKVELTDDKKEIHVYAVWERCSVNYYSDEKGTQLYKSFAFEPGATVTVGKDDKGAAIAPPTIADGRVFGDWSKKSPESLVISDSNGVQTFTMPDDDVDFVPVLLGRVTYDSNGASGEAPKEVNYAAGTEITIAGVNGLTKDGYAFGGWQTSDITGSDVTYKAGDKFEMPTPSKNIKFTAVWNKITYQLEYSEGTADGVINMPDDENDLTYDDIKNGYQLSTNKPERTGYTFKSWKVGENDNAASVILSDFAKVSDTVYKATATAQWEEKSYTVVYHKNSPTGSDGDVSDMPPNATVLYSQLKSGYNLSGVPKCRNYTFQYWSKSANGPAVTKVGLDDVSVSGTVIDVYAVWQKDDKRETFDVVYSGGFNSLHKSDVNSPTQKYSIQVNEDGSNPSYTILSNTWFNRVGYSSDSWIVSTADGKTRGFSAFAARIFSASSYKVGDVLNAGDEITLDASLYLTVNWTLNNYAVKYNKNTDDNVENMPADEFKLTVESGFTLNSNKDDYIHALSQNKPIREGYEFVGWSTDKNAASGANTVGLSQFGDSDSVTVYAVWRNYRVIYNGNDATSGSVPIDDNTYKAGERVTVLDKGNLANGSYTFKEWNTSRYGNGTAYQANDVFEMPADDVTLYAIWSNLGGDIVPGDTTTDNTTFSPNTGESLSEISAAVYAMIISIIVIFGLAVYCFKRKEMLET